MPKPIAAPFTARIEGDFVVFLIGMRINRPWRLRQWAHVFFTMPRLLKELRTAGPEIGFLGHSPIGMTLIAQYWRSFEQLEAYARSRDAQHWPAWVTFNRIMKGKRGDVGIWHETYKVRAGEYECFYSGMPPFGLSSAAEIVMLGKSGQHQSAARDRLAGKLE